MTRIRVGWIVVSLALGCLWIAAQLVAGFPRASVVPLAISEFVAIGAAGLSMAVGVAGVALLVARRTRPTGLQAIGAAVALWLCLLPAGFVVGSIRDEQFRRVVARARPLIGAIESYEHKRGYPPARLEELVPEYLPELPGTGLAVDRQFNYTQKCSNERGRWRVWISVGPTPMDWDVLEYRPGQEYPAHVSRFGAWALVGD